MCLTCITRRSRATTSSPPEPPIIEGEAPPTPMMAPAARTTTRQPPRRRNPKEVSIYNATNFPISLKEMRRMVATNPPRMTLLPGQRSSFNARPSSTYFRMAVFQQESDHDKNVNVYLDMDEVADMDDQAIRVDETSQKFYLEPDPPPPHGNGCAT